jgi:hypothetical protein
LPNNFSRAACCLPMLVVLSVNYTQCIGHNTCGFGKDTLRVKPAGDNGGKSGLLSTNGVWRMVLTSVGGHVWV